MTESVTKNSHLTKELPKNWILLLENYYNQEFFTPTHWEDGKKAINYFATIDKGKKSIFDRKFLRNSIMDDLIVYRKKDFPENEIIEQKAVYVKGINKEAVFHGFFIIHHRNDCIYGEEITQKEALMFFDAKERLPDIDEPEKKKKKLRVKLGIVIRKLIQKYGDEIICEVLTDILEEYFPNT